MDKGLIALVALCVVGFLGFFIYATSSSAVVADNYGSGTVGQLAYAGQLAVQKEGAQLQPTAAALSFQDVEIRGTARGFQPASVRVKAGQPVKVSFTADGNAGCGRALLIKKAGISLVSKGGQTETAEFTPEKGVYAYKCSMAMFGGEIQAE